MSSKEFEKVLSYFTVLNSSWIWFKSELSLLIMLSFAAPSINSTVSLFFYILHSFSPHTFQCPSMQHFFSYYSLLL